MIRFPCAGLAPRLRRRMSCRALPCLLLAIIAAPPALANNYGESLAWQFRSPADLAMQISLLDLAAKRHGGYYAAPVYSTIVDRQYVCSVGATAMGNEDSQSAVANSPEVSGTTANATGNSGTTSASGPGRAGSAQDNTGMVGAGVTGSTGSTVRGDPWQALNSSQSNSGNQSASVTGSTGCSFGTLN